MLRLAVEVHQQLDDARPFVRPTYNELEVTLLPPYGDPEVHILSEVGTYVAAGLLVNAVTERLYDT